MTYDSSPNEPKPVGDQGEPGEPGQPEDRERGAKPPLFQIAAVFYFLLAFAGVVWVGLDRGSIPLDLFVQPATLLGDVGLGLVVGALLVLIWEGARRVVPAVAALDTRLRDVLRGITVPEALVLAALSGFAEEFFFRGAVQGSVGWLWATILFAAIHTGPERLLGLWSAYALLAGGLFAALTELRGSILPAVTAHMVVNGVQLARLAFDTTATAPDVSTPR